LGLYLVKQQIEKLNGRVEIESKLNEGTTFKIFLPIRQQR
jgi:chemotaxis protein histidine kinase CheA